jgi:hypothetical protein
MTQIVFQANGRSIRGMEACLGLVEQGGRGLPESIPIPPEATAGELRLEEAPDPLQEVEVRRIDRQPEGEHPTLLGRPPGTHGHGAVIADAVQHQHEVIRGLRLVGALSPIEQGL